MINYYFRLQRIFFSGLSEAACDASGANALALLLGLA